MYSFALYKCADLVLLTLTVIKLFCDSSDSPSVSRIISFLRLGEAILKLDSCLWNDYSAKPIGLLSSEKGSGL